VETLKQYQALARFWKELGADGEGRTQGKVLNR